MVIDLSEYGWSKSHTSGTKELGRILRVDRGECDVITEEGKIRVLSDSKRSQNKTAPATGDWVRVAEVPDLGTVIQEILPRKNKLSRTDPSSEGVEQVLVANVDLVLIVHGLDRPLPPGRIERLLTLAWDSQSEVVVILTKKDKAKGSIKEIEEIIEAIAPGLSVIPVNAKSDSDAGLNKIKKIIKNGQTAALIGESGAGKSTLVNALVGNHVAETGEVRDGDRRGRHTTVTREILLSPDGGLLVDTPGLRSIGIWDAKETLKRVFADLEERAGDCRFSDCGHGNEPDCAVLSDVESGLMDEKRVSRYKGLLLELSIQNEKLLKRQKK